MDPHDTYEQSSESPGIRPDKSGELDDIGSSYRTDRLRDSSSLLKLKKTKQLEEVDLDISKFYI